MSTRPARRCSRCHRAVGIAAALAAATLAAAGCTTEIELRPGVVRTELTQRWAEADIAQVPPGTLHRLSRYELHDEVDPLLPDESGGRRTGYVVRYATEMDREQVIAYYRDRFGDDWDFAPADRWATHLKAYRGGLQAEIRLVMLVHGPDELPEIRALATEVTVLVSDDSRLRDHDPTAGDPAD